MRRLGLTLLAMFTAANVFAQSDRGAVKGLVVDQQGRVIPGAVVALTNAARGVRLEKTSDGSGSFLFPSLVAGRYEISAQIQGFKKVVRTDVDVEVGRTTDLAILLEAGQMSEEVTIESTPGALQLDRATSDTGTTVTPRQILDLPVPLTGNMRNPLNFVVLTPGVSGSVPTGVPDLRLNISGAPAASFEVYIDGIPVANTESSGDVTANHPAIESIGEFKITNNSYPAENGLASGIISFALRSGTNDFHGSAFEYHQNDALNALDEPTKILGGEKAPLKQNEYGFTLGGPVVRDKTFFFASYSGFKFRPSANNPDFTTIPNRFREGDFSQQLGAQVLVPNPLNPAELLPLFDAAGRPVLSGSIYDPTRSRTVVGPDGRTYVIRDPFPGNIIPGGYGGLSPASQRILQDFPRADSDALFNNFSRQTQQQRDQHRFLLKLQHNLSERHNLAGSVSVGRSRFSNNGLLNELSATGNDRPSLAVRFNHAFTVSPNLLNSFSFGFLRDTLNDGALESSPPLGELGFSGISLPEGAPYPIIGLRNQNGIGSDFFVRIQEKRFVINDSVTWARGNHTFKFGGEFRHLENNQNSNNAGRFAFEPTQTALNGIGFVNTANGPVAVSIPGGATGSSVASFLFGAVDFSRFDLGVTPAKYRWTTISGFVQDDWRVTRNLTLNLGLRYDVSIPRTEAAGNVSTMDPSLPNPAAGGVLGAYTFFGDGPGRNGRKRIGAIDWSGIQPRIGFAFTPKAESGLFGKLFGDERSVLRGSFAITRPLGNDNLVNGIGGGLYTAGFNGVATVNRPGDALGSPAFFWDDPFPGFTPPPTLEAGLLSGNANPAFITPDSGKLPRQLNWGFEFQRQLPGGFLGSIGYVGTHATNLGLWRKPNQVRRDVAERYRGAAALAGLPLNEYLNLPITDPRVGAGGPPLPFPNFVSLFGPGATVAQALRPFPQYGNIDMLLEPVGHVSYNGLLAKLQKRFSGGLTMLMSYTYSKTLGDVDSFIGAFAGAQNAIFARSFQQDFYDNPSERSVTSSDVPHVLALSYTYELPFGPGKKWANKGGIVGKLLGGWQFSGIHLYQSGRPLFMEYQAFGANNPNRANDGFSFRPNIVPGVPVVNPDWDPSCAGPLPNTPGRRSCEFYINPAAFTAPPPGEFGNAPKFISTLRARPYLNEDFSLVKRTPIGDRVVLHFQVSAFNVFNRVVWAPGGPPTTIFNLAPKDLSEESIQNSNTPFGILTAQQNDPRRIQLGVRVEF